MYRIVFITLFISSLHAHTLQGLITTGLNNAHTLKLSNNQVKLADIEYKESLAKRYGSLDLSTDLTHYNVARTLAPLTPSVIGSQTPVTTTKDLLSAGVLYTLPLFTGFAQTQDIAINKLSKNIALMRARLNKEQLIYNIKTLYLAILAQQEGLQAQRRYTHALQKLVQSIDYEVKLGKKATLDLLKIQSDLESSRSKETLFETTLAITKASLASLVGIRELRTISPIAIKLKKPHYNLQTLLQDSANLAKIKLEDTAIIKANHAIKKSKASTLPQVNLVGYAGKNYGEDEALGDMDSETLWQVGVNVKWNIVDFGRSKLAQEKAKIAKMNALDQKEQTLLELKKLLIEGLETIKLHHQTYRQYLAQRTLLTKAQEIEQIRYHQGVATINDLLLVKAEGHLVQARLIQSKYDYQKSIYFIQYIMESGAKYE